MIDPVDRFEGHQQSDFMKHGTAENRQAYYEQERHEKGIHRYLRKMVFGVWCFVFGVLCFVFRVWYLVFRVWKIISRKHEKEKTRNVLWAPQKDVSAN